MAAVCHSTDLRQMRNHGLERERIVNAVRSLDVIFALHEEQKREIVEIFDVEPAKVLVIGTGYNAQEFSPADKRVTNDGVSRLLYVGKIGYKKGVESLIAALDLLAKRVWWAGIAMLRNMIESRSELPHVRYLSHSRAKLARMIWRKRIARPTCLCCHRFSKAFPL